jgi:hypothetical protein
MAFSRYRKVFMAILFDQPEGYFWHFFLACPLTLWAFVLTRALPFSYSKVEAGYPSAFSYCPFSP